MYKVGKVSKHLETLLQESGPMPFDGNCGIQQVLNSICTRIGIDALPKLRYGPVSEDLYKGTHALHQHNTIIVNPNIKQLPLDEMEMHLANTLGHLVLKHASKADARPVKAIRWLRVALGHDRLGFAQEKAADRFALFAISGGEEGTRPLHSMYEYFDRRLAEHVEPEDSQRSFLGIIGAKLFPGLTERAKIDLLVERVEKLESDLSESEEKRFAKAIRDHNQRHYSECTTVLKPTPLQARDGTPETPVQELRRKIGWAQRAQKFKEQNMGRDGPF